MNILRSLWLRRAFAGVVALVASCLGLVVTSPAPAHASGCGHVPLIFTATAANTSGYILTLDNDHLNGQPGADPVITQLWPSQYDAHPVGTWYNTSNGRWTIFNEDGANIPLGTSFTLQLVCEIYPTLIQMQITATSSNTQGDTVYINSPTTNGNPQAVVYATQAWTGTYNAHEIGVYYSPGYTWAIFNLDHSPMPIGASFNILAFSSGGGFNLNVTATASNTVGGYMVYLNDPLLNGNAGLAPVVSQDFIVGPCSKYTGCPGVINNHPIGVWYDTGAGRWVIYNVDLAAMPAGATFFIAAM